MKILLDMNIPLKYKALLTKRGIETLRWTDVGVANAADVEIMAYACNNDMIVLTCDLELKQFITKEEKDFRNVG